MGWPQLPAAVDCTENIVFMKLSRRPLTIGHEAANFADCLLMAESRYRHAHACP